MTQYSLYVDNAFGRGYVMNDEELNHTNDPNASRFEISDLLTRVLPYIHANEPQSTTTITPHAE